MKQFINSKYHSVCKPTKTGDSKLLFNDDFSTHLKALNKTIKIGKSLSFSGVYQGCRYHPYGQNGGQNRNCSGKSTITTHTQVVDRVNQYSPARRTSPIKNRNGLRQ